MPRLPKNAKRIRDGHGGYDYGAYAKDGSFCRLRRGNVEGWVATCTRTDERAGYGRTITDCAKAVALFVPTPALSSC